MQKRIKNGLDKVQASIVDIDQSSLFDIFIPKQLRLGKNEIKIRLVNDNTLLKGSEVLIDVLDQFGNPLYYEISNIANEDKTRSIIVSVFENDQGGRGQLFIYGKLSSTSDYLCKINLEINPRLETEQEIKFDNPPEIFYQEKRIPVQNITSQTRLLYKSGSNSRFSTLSPTIPKQLQPGIFDVERQELKTQISNGNVTNGIATSSLVQIPEYLNLGIITAENFIFSSSFKGGQIWVRNLNLEIPNDSLTATPFLNQVYSASIVEVISTSSIQVYPPFNLKIEYQSQTGLKVKVYDRFINEGNVTSSYFDVLTLSQGSYTQSYAVFDIFDLEPKSGKVDSVDISYKNLSLFGDNYEPLGNFKVRSENILVDKNNSTFDPNKGIVEKQIGEFISGFESYWQTSSLPNLISNNEVPNGILLRDKQILELKSNYSPQVSKNSEWILSFDYFSEPSQSLEPQLDVYVSGSEIRNLTKETLILYTPSQSSQLGTYIGSVINNKGKTELIFEVKEKSKITPKIRPTNGLWSIGNVKLRPNEKNGFTPKQTRIFAPLSIPTGSELNFKIEYVNPVGQKTTNFSSLLPGVYFEGNNDPTLKIISSSLSKRIGNLEDKTGSYATTGSNTFSGSQKIIGYVTASVVSSSYYDFDKLTNGEAPVWQEGRLYYDTNYGAFTAFNDESEFSLRIGQEDLLRAYNNSGVTITKGTPVRISGSQGDYPYIWTAKAEIHTSSYIHENHIIGLASHDIEDKSTGYVTQRGTIRGVNTSTLYTGDVLFLSSSLGQLTATVPNYPYEVVRVGYVIRAHSNGIVFVEPKSSTNIREINNFSSSLTPKNKDIWVYDSSISTWYNTNKDLVLTGSFSGSFHGMISSSNQIKNLLPDGTVSSSVQLTSSYDTRYHRLGTGVISSSGQIATDISGSFTTLSSSFQSRISIFENKTLISGSEQLTGSYDVRYERKGTGIFSSSGQVDYNNINNRPKVSGSGLYRLLISSGSDSSSSYADPRLTYDTVQNKFTLSGSFHITGSLSPRATYIWDGPKIADSTTPGIVWTNMQNLRNTWLGRGGTMTLDANYIGDFSEMTQGRLYTAMSVAGAGPTCSLEVQYSVDGISWNSMIYVGIGNTVGNKDSGWTALPSESKQFCYIRLTGYGGDGVTDPRFSPPIALFR